MRHGKRVDAYLELLAGLYPFRASSRDELRAIARSSTLVSRPGGSVLAREGTTSRELLVLASGSALVSRHGRPDGMLQTGDWFGDADLLSKHGSSSATLVALTDTDLVVMSRSEFLAAFAGAPSFRRRVVTSLAERARVSPSSAPQTVPRRVEHDPQPA